MPPKKTRKSTEKNVNNASPGKKYRLQADDEKPLQPIILYFGGERPAPGSSYDKALFGSFEEYGPHGGPGRQLDARGSSRIRRNADNGLAVSKELAVPAADSILEQIEKNTPSKKEDLYWQWFQQLRRQLYPQPEIRSYDDTGALRPPEFEKNWLDEWKETPSENPAAKGIKKLGKGGLELGAYGADAVSWLADLVGADSVSENMAESAKKIGGNAKRIRVSEDDLTPEQLERMKRDAELQREMIQLLAEIYKPSEEKTPDSKPAPELRSYDDTGRLRPLEIEQNWLDEWMETPSENILARGIKKMGKEDLKGGAEAAGTVRWLADVVGADSVSKEAEEWAKIFSASAKRIKVSKNENLPWQTRLTEEPIDTVFENFMGFLPRMLAAAATDGIAPAITYTGKTYNNLVDDPNASVFNHTKEGAQLLAPIVGLLAGTLLSSPGGKEVVAEFGEKAATNLFVSGLTASLQFGGKLTALSVVDRMTEALALLPEEERIKYVTNPEAFKQYFTDFLRGAAAKGYLKSVQGE